MSKLNEFSRQAKLYTIVAVMAASVSLGYGQQSSSGSGDKNSAKTDQDGNIDFVAIKAQRLSEVGSVIINGANKGAKKISSEEVNGAKISKDNLKNIWPEDGKGTYIPVLSEMGRNEQAITIQGYYFDEQQKLAGIVVGDDRIGGSGSTAENNRKLYLDIKNNVILNVNPFETTNEAFLNKKDNVIYIAPPKENCSGNTPADGVTRFTMSNMIGINDGSLNVKKALAIYDAGNEFLKNSVVVNNLPGFGNLLEKQNITLNNLGELSSSKTEALWQQANSGSAAEFNSPSVKSSLKSQM